jgi:hypothetical protein
MAKLRTTGEWTREQKDAARTILLEASPYETDGGELIGRDPRKIPISDFERAGVEPTMVGGGGLDVIRARCLDCCVEQEAEVRKCVAVACVNWPYRMGANPFRKQNLSEEDRERRRAQGRVLAASRLAAPAGDGKTPSENSSDAPAAPDTPEARQEGAGSLSTREGREEAGKAREGAPGAVLEAS